METRHDARKGRRFPFRNDRNSPGYIAIKKKKEKKNNRFASDFCADLNLSVDA